MKIAMFGHKRIPSREGGIEIVVEELATRMVELGHDVTCYNRRGHHVSGREFDTQVGDRYKGVHLNNVFTIDKRGLAAMTSSFSAAWKSAWGYYDVVHIHAEGPAAMCFLPKMLGKRVVVTIHGLDWARSKWGWFSGKYIKWGEKQAVKYADKIIVLNKSTQDYFREIYGRETVYIPNGINKPIVRKADLISKRWGLDKDSFVLFVGRIVPEKGLKYLIEAWKGINTDKKLVITGGSSDTDAYLEELKKDCPDNVLFTGFQQGIVLEELYSNSYVYVLPSDLEGMPLSLLEAMSYGNCCVVSDISENKSVVGEYALTFQKSNAYDLREMLQNLLYDANLVSEYRKSTSDYVCEKYKWDSVVERTLEIYQ